MLTRRRYANERPREREYERAAPTMPPPAARAPASPVATRDDTLPSATNPMEAWAISQVQTLKRQQEAVVKAIADFEKMISSGVLRTAALAVSGTRPTSTSSASTPARPGEYRQEHRPDSRPEPRLEQRLEPHRMEPRPDQQRLEHHPSYPESRPAPIREPSPPPPPARAYDEPRDPRPAPSPRNQPPYGAKDYEYSDSPRYTPKDSYGKAPTYKSFETYRKHKPYNRRPYDRSPNDRGPSPTRSQYDSGRRGSWDTRAPPPNKYDYR